MVSIVVPVFNEEESLPIFYKELIGVVSNFDGSYEIIFIDDGSADNSLDILKNFEIQNNYVRVFSFRKNQGKAEALTFGFQKIRGEYIITLDSDLQDIPSEIPKLLGKIKKGYDVVSGWRINRKDSLPKLFFSKIFNFLVRVFWNLSLHDFNCGLKAYTKDAAKSLRLYGGLHRFIPLLAYQQGFKVTEVPILHQKRRYGRSKFGISKIWSDLPDIFTMLFLVRYSKRPLHFFGMAGGILFTIGIIILGYLAMLRFQGETIGRRPLLFFGMLLVLSGLQVFFTGFLADLMINLSQQRNIKDHEDESVLLKYKSEKDQKYVTM